MARIYLSNLAADVSGYKLAFVGYRNPAASAVVSSTATTATGDNIQLKAADGTTALKWITKPFTAAVTITSAVTLNAWCYENTASVNTGIGVQMLQYTSSEQAAFWNHSPSAELTSASGVQTRLVFTTTTGTATAFSAGDRLVIKLFADNVGGMGADGIGVQMGYDGATEGAAGDTFLDLCEAIRVNEQQPGPGNYPTNPQFGQGFFQNIIDGLNACIGAQVLPNTNAVTNIVDELGFQRDNL